MRSALIGVLAASALTAPVQASAQGASVFLTPPADPSAVTVEARGDGRADDSEALQRAFDRAVDAIAPQVEGKFASAFVRAVKK